VFQDLNSLPPSYLSFKLHQQKSNFNAITVGLTLCQNFHKHQDFSVPHIAHPIFNFSIKCHYRCVSYMQGVLEGICQPFRTAFLRWNYINMPKTTDVRIVRVPNNGENFLKIRAVVHLFLIKYTLKRKAICSFCNVKTCT
jgi:hypothetical protein